MNGGGLTVKKKAGKFNTDVAVPLRRLPTLDVLRHAQRTELLDSAEYSVLRPVAHNDLRHAEKERLDPVSHQFPIEFESVVMSVDFSGGFELHPVDRLAWRLGFRIPYFVSVSILRS